MIVVAYVRGSGIYNDSRATKEVETLLKSNKYKVKLFAWDRSGTGKAEIETKKQFARYGNLLEFNFINVKSAGGSGIKGIFKLVDWMRYVKKKLDENRDIEIVHACNLEAGIPAFWYCKKNNIKFIYDIYDYYVDAHHVPAAVSNIVEKKEIKIINFADTTVICTEERREQISKATPKEIVVLHNSPDIPSVSGFFQPDYDYTYCGALIDRRLLEEITDSYKDNSDLRFVFAGSGKLSEKIKRLSINYERFEYLGALPYSDVLEIEKKSNVISAIYEPTVRNHKLCAPNKFYESLALGKPVIVCKDTGIDKIVEKYQIGKVINYSAIEFYDAVRYYKNHMDECKDIYSRARKLYEDKYAWEIMKGKLLSMYEKVL